jgi:hypothetical protein
MLTTLLQHHGLMALLVLVFLGLASLKLSLLHLLVHEMLSGISVHLLALIERTQNPDIECNC